MPQASLSALTRRSIENCPFPCPLQPTGRDNLVVLVVLCHAHCAVSITRKSLVAFEQSLLYFLSQGKINRHTVQKYRRLYCGQLICGYNQIIHHERRLPCAAVLRSPLTPTNCRKPSGSTVSVKRPHM